MHSSEVKLLNLELEHTIKMIEDYFCCPNSIDALHKSGKSTVSLDEHKFAKCFICISSILSYSLPHKQKYCLSHDAKVF